MSDAVSPTVSAGDTLDAAGPALRWNQIVLAGDVTCFFIGVAFLDTTTVLPLLVIRLGGGAVVLAILTTLRQAGYYLPQVFVAHRLQGRRRCKPFLLKVCAFGRIWMFGAAVVFWRFGRGAPVWALAALGAAYALSWFGDGLGSVPWTAIVAKAVPPQTRGRLFATTQILGGFGRLGVGVVVAVVLSGKLLGFPANGALILLGAATCSALSWAFLAAIREPVSPRAGATDDAEGDMANAGLLDYLKAIPDRFRTRPDVARLAATQLLISAAAAVTPFLFAHAARCTPGGLPAGSAGGLLIVQTIGLLVCAPLIGMITDRRGAARSLRLLFVLALVCLFAAILGAQWPGGRNAHLFLFGVAYFCSGGVADAWTTVTNYLLEAVTVHAEQSTYIGLINASAAPALALPLLLGRLVAADGTATAAFAAAAVLVTAGFVFSLSLPDPHQPGTLPAG